MKNLLINTLSKLAFFNLVCIWFPYLCDIKNNSTMSITLKKIKNITSEACVTIILNTHRTKPDNIQDPINLKNLVKNAENRLLADYEKRFAQPIIDRLNDLADSIDHQYNLESLILFVNENIAEYTRLPIGVVDRVVLDNTFATRDLVRAMNQEANYYVLILNRQEVRLLEAQNDKFVQEVKGEFPMDNDVYSTDRHKLSMAKGQDNMIEEFFNRVDKAMLAATAERPLPVLLAAETRNFDHYVKIADKKDLILGHINKDGSEVKAHQIVADAWEEVKSITKSKQAERISELKKAVSEGNFVSDFNDIWSAISEGRGKTLFVKKGFFQPALISGNEILLVDKIERDQKGVCDDVIDEMIEKNLSFGGDTVFVEGDELSDFQGLGLVTRY
jgi:hypothetical protein